MFFPFCRLPEFLVSLCSSRSRCPSISASVSLLRRRMPSADVVSGIFWMNWREPRIIYCFERKSFFASFVSFPRSKLQNKEVAGPQTSNSGYKREDASTGSRGDVFVVRKSKPVENLWKNGLFWSRYGFVTHSIDRKPRDWGLARSAYSIKYGKGGNKFGADFRIPETQMELNEIAWFY